MRKLFSVVIVVLLSLTFCFALMACDAATGDTGKDYDDAIKDLQDRIETLENSLSDTQDALDTANTEIANLQNYFAADGKIYSVGETATIYSNGIKLMEVTFEGPYDDNPINAKNMRFTVTNPNVTTVSIKELLAIQFISNDSAIETAEEFNGTLLPNEPTSVSRNCHLPSIKYIYIGFLSNTDGIVPCAIFKP